MSKRYDSAHSIGARDSKGTWSAQRAEGAGLIRFGDDAQQQQLFADAPVDHAECAGGQLPQGWLESMQLLELVKRQLSGGESEDISFDALTKSIRNGQKIAFGVPCENDVKRSWTLAHAPGTRSSLPRGRLGDPLRPRRSCGETRGCIPS